MRRNVAVVVPAGGAGLRMGTGVRKQYLELGGQPILLRSLRVFLDHPAVRWIIVSLPADDMDPLPSFLPERVVAVAGGEQRGDSVRAALEAVPGGADTILIHDAARPLLTRAVVDRVVGATTADTGAIAAVPVADTLKRVGDDGAVLDTVDRRRMWQAQTPQGFARDVIVGAYERAAVEGVTATDDAALVERYGGRVVVVEGDVRNIKITRPRDLDLAETLLRSAERR